jgi:hypothetical protein
MVSALDLVVVLPNMIANGNLVLESTGPTLMILGSGGADTTANTIMYINGLF